MNTQAVATRRPDQGMTPASTGTAMSTATSARAVAEVQGAMLMARQYPRDEGQSYASIMEACQRPKLAELAMYTYPKGGQTITGPSIRLVEAIALRWGNLDTGIIELETRDGESSMMAYCTDLQTNMRKTILFTARHQIDTTNGPKILKEGRDIYENNANLGARRLRACIMAVIPEEVIHDAVGECRKTLENNATGPKSDRIKKMIAKFAAFGVDRQMIEKRLGHKAEVTSEAELVTLTGIYKSLSDEQSGPGDHFDVEVKANARGLNDALDTPPKQAEKKTGRTTPPATPKPETASPDAPAWAPLADALAARLGYEPEEGVQILADKVFDQFGVDVSDLTPQQIAATMTAIGEGKLDPK